MTTYKRKAQHNRRAAHCRMGRSNNSRQVVATVEELTHDRITISGIFWGSMQLLRTIVNIMLVDRITG